jgi:putative glutamine amidotransferase
LTPLVGLTTYVTHARYSHWDLEAALIPSRYVDAIERSGGRPILLPPATIGIDETLDAIDALVLPGGPDIDPQLYGQQPHPETRDIDRRRDEAELRLLHGVLQRNMPLLGICRGGQAINIAFGGDLYQHLPEVVGHGRHKHHLPDRFIPHDIQVTPGTRLARAIGSQATVQSRHHQGFRRLGSGLIEAAVTADGLIEAVEAPGQQFVLGVLWHAEVSTDTPLFTALLEHARDFRAKRLSSSTIVASHTPAFAPTLPGSDLPEAPTCPRQQRGIL